jgi:cytoskeletal protein CcmA (bactofilin family)
MSFKKGKAAGESVSLLGEGSELVGEISFTDGLLVNGSIQGKVRSEATLEIGPRGKVDAEVTVRKMLIKGEFRGVIRASDRVEIYKDGRVLGDIYSPCLIIEAGALFDGNCNMADNKQAASGAEGVLLKTASNSSKAKPLSPPPDPEKTEEKPKPKVGHSS